MALQETARDPSLIPQNLKVDGSGNLLVAGSFSVAAGTEVKVTDGTDDLEITSAGAAKVDGSGVTQPVSLGTGTLANGAETTVAGTAVEVLAANASRKVAVVQNTGAANIRIGVIGVTATTGFRLVPSGHIIFEQPNVPINAIFAIREGVVSSTAFAQEVT